jgi:prepilin-type N-terminal cleavage/methylation domain-containing protein
MDRHVTRGFTLVELLVVIAIIVLLLSLLTPALEKAIYQAELAVCAANLKSYATGVTTYAGEQKRAFPSRALANEPFRVKYNNFNYRRSIAGYVPLKTLVDPLSGKIDLSIDSTGTDAVYDLFYSNYEMWAGYGYTGFTGLLRLGDRFEWVDPVTGIGHRYDALIADRDMIVVGSRFTTASHPDDRDAMTFQRYQNEDTPFGTLAAQGLPSGTKITFSWWTGNRRGTLDTNYGHADGSVRRFVGVVSGLKGGDDRMARVPDFANNPSAYATGRGLQAPPAE